MPSIAALHPSQNLPPQTAIRSQAVQTTQKSQAIQSPQDQLKLSGKAAPGPLPRDGILFLGMNPQSSNELKALRASHAPVRELKSENGKIEGFDLNQAPGRAAFIAALELSPERAQAFSQLLEQAQAEGRDELAQLAKIWKGSELGQKIPGRVVISGHSNGLKIWSEAGRGSLQLSEIAHLAKIFPAAAAEIEDLHISACNTGYRSNIAYWQDVFPNLKTFWAYTHTAPSSAYASPAHLRAWEKATRGPAENLNRKSLQKILSGAVRSENLALWSKQSDYQSSLSTQAHNRDDLTLVVNRYLQGEEAVANPQTGPLKLAYDQLQSLRGETGDSSLDAPIGQALLLRFYPSLSQNFNAAYQTQLSEAAALLQLPPADFSQISRKESLLWIERFQTAFREQKPSLEAESLAKLEKVNTLLSYWKNLNPDYFAPEWIETLSSAQLAQAQADFEALHPLPQWIFMPGLGFPGGNLAPLTFPGLEYPAATVPALGTELERPTLNFTLGQGNLLNPQQSLQWPAAAGF